MLASGRTAACPNRSETLLRIYTQKIPQLTRDATHIRPAFCDLKQIELLLVSRIYLLLCVNFGHSSIGLSIKQLNHATGSLFSVAVGDKRVVQSAPDRLCSITRRVPLSQPSLQLVHVHTHFVDRPCSGREAEQRRVNSELGRRRCDTVEQVVRQTQLSGNAPIAILCLQVEHVVRLEQRFAECVNHWVHLVHRNEDNKRRDAVEQHFEVGVRDCRLPADRTSADDSIQVVAQRATVLQRYFSTDRVQILANLRQLQKKKLLVVRDRKTRLITCFITYLTALLQIDETLNMHTHFVSSTN